MVAFALGVMPGTDMVAAADVIAGETGDVRAIPRLPARGIMSDAVGATCALLPDAPVAAGPRSWRLEARPQLITRRLWDQAERDLDLLEAEWGSSGFTVQVAALGPWSLAAQVELSNGHLAVTDPGALHDLTEIVTYGLAEHASRLRRRFHGEVNIQVNEPLLAALNRGEIAGTNDFDVLRPIPVKELGERLHYVFESLPGRRLLGSGSRPLFDVACIAQPDAIIVPQSALVGSELLDGCAATLDAGIGVSLGCVTLGNDVDDARDVAIQIAQLFDELCMDRAIIPELVDVTNAREFTSGDLVSVARALACARVADEILVRDVGDL